MSWPFLYSIKLGQVGPLLFLLFALGWRWLDRGRGCWASPAALGAAIKMQPGLVLVWALLTRRWPAVVAGARWRCSRCGARDARRRRRGLDRLPRAHRPGQRPDHHAQEPHAGRGRATGWGCRARSRASLQWASMAAALVAVVVAALRLPPAPSYLVAVIASQLLSPILWEHYALLLLLPVAWLVDRGQWWAVVIPLLTPLFLVGSCRRGLPARVLGDARRRHRHRLKRGSGVHAPTSVPVEPVSWSA